MNTVQTIQPIESEVASLMQEIAAVSAGMVSVEADLREADTLTLSAQQDLEVLTANVEEYEASAVTSEEFAEESVSQKQDEAEEVREDAASEVEDTALEAEE
jgi:hypothetical protein